MSTAVIMPPCESHHRIAASAMRAFGDALGGDHVLEELAVAEHVDPYSFLGDATVAPAAVARPSCVAEVQAIVRLANQHHVPLWPVSTGRNYAYGGASPRVPGSLVVDLSRMNQVVSVDEECGVAVVQPGVTFMQFAEHLRARGSRLMPSVPDIGWGSLIGNALERGFGYTPYGDHSTMLCGMEVVLPTGDLIHTGMSAKANSAAAHLYKGGYGPGVDGLFQQSNLGIVTEAGVWLMPRPRQVASCAVKVPNQDDIAPLIDALRPLLLDGTIQSNAAIGSATVIAAAMGQRADFCPPDAVIGDAEIAAIKARFGLGYWNARFGLYGTEALIAARLESVREALARVPGADLDVQLYDGDVEPDAVARPHRASHGIPSLDMARIAAWRGGQPAHTDYSMVLPPTGRSALAASQMIRGTVEAHGFDYCGGFTLFARHMISLSLIAFDRDDARHCESVARLCPELIRKASDLGAAPYRSHIAFMDLTAEQYDADDHGLQKMVQRIKAAIDPNGILAPGKQGIWPEGENGSVAESGITSGRPGHFH